MHALPIHFAGRQGAFVYRHGALAAAIDAAQPDVLLHEQEVFALGATQVAHLASRRSIPLAMFVWENVARKLSAPRRRMRDCVLRRCAALIAGGQRSAEVHRGWGFTGPIAAIPQMGVAALDPAPVFGRRCPDALRVCFAGRLIAAKGVDCLLRAVALLKAQAVPVHCTIAGAGDRLAALRRLAAALQVSDRVVFAGALQPAAVVGLLRRSDALVLPSRRTPTWEEQFGRVLVEAMAQATVTAGSRTGAIAEVIGCQSLLFDQDDARGLAAILARLHRDGAFLEAQQRRLRDRARDLYLYEALAARRVAFLRQVLAGGPAC